MADCNFLQKAIAIVTQATELDSKKEYAEAFQKYQLALEYFMTALKCNILRSIDCRLANPYNTMPTDEKNEKCKQTIRVKVEEYIARAEKLKEFLQKAPGRRPVAQGSSNSG